jgi:hypothetical protein
VTLLSGAFVIYAAGPGEAEEFTVTVIDTASGRLLKSATASTGRSGELLLLSPCICKLAAAPISPGASDVSVEQVIALAVLPARGRQVAQ